MTDEKHPNEILDSELFFDDASKTLNKMQQPLLISPEPENPQDTECVIDNVTKEMKDLQMSDPEEEVKEGTIIKDMKELEVIVIEREEERVTEGSEKIKQFVVSGPELEEQGILKVTDNMEELHVSVTENEDEEKARGLEAKEELQIKEKEGATEEEKSKEEEKEEELQRDALLQFINEAEVRISGKMSLRHKNQTTQKPDEAALAKHDSSLKKNTAFVRKLRNFTAQQLNPLLKDMANLNLTKYISEVAAALVDVKLKLTDVPAAVQLCSELHCTYQEFSKVLLELWVKVLTLKKDDKISNPSKLRVDLRFYGDLITTGIFPQKDALPLLGNVLTMLTTMDKEEHNNISIILSFCRHCGEDYAGLVPRSIQQLSKKFDMPVPRSSALLPEKQKNVRALLKDYYSSLCRHIRKVYVEVQAFERQNRRILQTKGELSNDRKEKGEILGASLMRLITSANNFAEILDEDLPAIPDDKSNRHDQVTISESEEAASLLGIWEDDETQRFYQEFPNIKEFLPHIRFPKEAVAHSSMSEEKLDEELKEDELEDDGRRDYDMHSHDYEDADDPENSANISSKLMLDAFLSHLPNCVNREMIDNAAVEFLMNHNTKHHRRKLVKVLFGVPRTRLDLLPFYSRMVAILSPVMPEVPQDLASLLKSDFRYHIRKKDQINIESKIKVIRFIGELVKFNLYSKIEGLYCLKVLLHDFTHHHIEMACNYLESCGRYFFRNPDTHQRTKVYLEQMMRKKAVMPLDYRYVTMIENAFYHVNPPETTLTKTKVRPVVHEFIRKLLYQDLVSSETDEQVLILLRKLDWDDAATSAYAIKCLTNAYNVKYFHIKTLANLLAGLVDYQEFVGAHVVDGVLEDIRIGMELNLPKLNQRRITMVKYLGELYNYRMLESNDVFKVLYSLISFGVTLDYDNPSPFDPPGNLFRIRLVCVLLETCGQYFSHGLSKTKLDYFLTYFQNYVQYKFRDPYWITSEIAFPVHMDFIYRDIVISLRPNLKLCSTFEESKAVVDELQVKFMAIIGQQPVQEQEDQGLPPIVERGPDGAVGREEETLKDEAIGGADDVPNDWEDIYSDDELYDEVGACVSPDLLKGSGDAQMTRLVDRERSISAKTDSYKDWVDYEIFDSDECSDNRNESPMSQEDEEFQTAFDRMVFDNIQERMKENIKHQHVDISVPLSIKTSSKKTYEQLLEPEQKDSNVNFTLMVRKGNKQQYKNLSVPTDSELAVNLRSQEEAERMEKERVKRLTLDINDRLEEEDYQDQLAQLANTNHQKKPSVKGKRKTPSQDYSKSNEATQRNKHPEEINELGKILHTISKRGCNVPGDTPKGAKTSHIKPKSRKKT